MKLRRSLLALTLSCLAVGSAAADSGSNAGTVAQRFHKVQAEQLSAIDQSLASGEVSFECAATLYEEQRAVRQKFDAMASDGAISRSEFQLANMMLIYAEQNIGGQCLTPR